MTTFWIPQSKHWCEFCKVWVQPDPVSIKHHENGKKHQDTVKNYLFEQRKKKTDDKRANDELQRTLADIDAAARDGPPADEAAPAGEYTVRGVTYRQGEHCLELLVAGAAAEAFVSVPLPPPPPGAPPGAPAAPPSWRPVTISRCHAVAVPNTKLMLRTYSVEFRVPLRAGDDAESAGEAEDAGSSGGGPLVTVHEVAPSNIRIIIKGGGDAEGAAPPPPPPPPPQPLVDEFGLPLWRPATPPPPPSAAAAAAAAAEGDGQQGGQQNAGAKRRRGADGGNPFAGGRGGGATAAELDAAAFDDGDEADAYAVHNPFGGKYRGVALDGAGGASRASGGGSEMPPHAPPRHDSAAAAAAGAGVDGEAGAVKDEHGIKTSPAAHAGGGGVRWVSLHAGGAVTPAVVVATVTGPPPGGGQAAPPPAGGLAPAAAVEGLGGQGQPGVQVVFKARALKPGAQMRRKADDD